MSFAVQASSPLSSFGYLLGKMVRISFFLIFLSAIFKHTDALAGYTLEQAALFFLTFNIVDILAQLFFRGIYGNPRPDPGGGILTIFSSNRLTPSGGSPSTWSISWMSLR